jgi:hypothetical protein
MSKKNPHKLNPLQLRTLTLLQALAGIPEAVEQGPGEGEVTITHFPHAHGSHFHLGDALVNGSDATGLFHEAVWHALDRKGLARADWPNQITLTKDGVAYDTEETANEILHRGHGHEH